MPEPDLDACFVCGPWHLYDDLPGAGVFHVPMLLHTLAQVAPPALDAADATRRALVLDVISEAGTVTVRRMH
ncbi:hypothetical protein JOF29_007145 [Kribbella aluminosa]|uniref:Uncharacterized protein n=1 Tax=Kribbella aluminosa TaxID=416017 RepID=A0ABS4UWM4_9ACTN|nr:hypothetical protein [Kribbella aluminosa]MBP2356035.1 hypothetical protein [Kribbella aluminosa]